MKLYKHGVATSDDVGKLRDPLSRALTSLSDLTDHIKGVAGIFAKIVMVKVKPSLLAQGLFYAGKEFP